MSSALKVGIAGLGTVGGAVLHILQRRRHALSAQCGRNIDVVAVSARDKTKSRPINLDKMRWYESAEALAQDSEIDVFIELIGGDEGVARQAVETALKAGKHVVTANKALLAKHGVALAKLAEDNGVLLNFEAAVAGGIPIIKVMRESLAANEIMRVYGILNGTCNYILTRMDEENLSFDACLKEAQELGYAEADPTFDVDGYDSAHKLALLTSLAFGTQVAADQVYVEGIRNICLSDIRAAQELGFKIKLLGVGVKTETGIEQRVHPTMVPLSSAIAEVGDVTNAISIKTDLLGELLLSGPGAGGNATASAVISDIADIARCAATSQSRAVFGVPSQDLVPCLKGQMRSHAGGYYIRLTVDDRAGVFASLAGLMASYNISLESIVQRPQARHGDDATKTIILVTHQTIESSVRKALLDIKSSGYLVGHPQMIRIERLV